MAKTRSTALKKWVAAAKKHGFLKRGGFKKLPSKGSAAYRAIKATYERSR